MKNYSNSIPFLLTQKIRITRGRALFSRFLVEESECQQNINWVSISRFFLSSCRPRQPPRPLDRSRQCPEEAETVFQIPDPRIGERVFVQRVRLEAEEVGASKKSKPDRTANQNMVTTTSTFIYIYKRKSISSIWMANDV